MTREEEIRKAALNYINGIIFSSPSDVFHFKNGAKWADEHPNLESIWHDSSEEPLLEEEIISISEYGSTHISERFCCTFLYNFEDYYWEEFVNSLKIKKWAYISDLLPKGGKK